MGKSAIRGDGGGGVRRLMANVMKNRLNIVLSKKANQSLDVQSWIELKRDVLDVKDPGKGDSW